MSGNTVGLTMAQGDGDGTYDGSRCHGQCPIRLGFCRSFSARGQDPRRLLKDLDSVLPHADEYMVFCKELWRLLRQDMGHPPAPGWNMSKPAGQSAVTRACTTPPLQPVIAAEGQPSAKSLSPELLPDGAASSATTTAATGASPFNAFADTVAKTQRRQIHGRGKRIHRRPRKPQPHSLAKLPPWPRPCSTTRRALPKPTKRLISPSGIASCGARCSSGSTPWPLS